MRLASALHIDRAIATGKSLQSKQTGLIHYCAQSKDLTTHHTIPIYENFLFVLALFRSRLQDNVLEARSVIERLLPFEVEGDFPVYLSDYPQVRDPFLGLRLLPIFYWILRDFSHVIGPMRKVLSELFNRLINHLKSSTSDLTQSVSHRGVPHSTLPQWVRDRLDAIQGKMPLPPQNVHDWSEALISAQIAENEGGEFLPLLEEASSVWHSELALYIGKAKRRHQWGSHPEITVFDLFMSVWHPSPSFPLLNFSESDHPVLLPPVWLHGALIRPLRLPYPVKKHGEPFVHFSQDEEAPFFVAWGRHTLVLAKRDLKVGGRGDLLIIEPPIGERRVDKGKAGSIDFYLNHHPDHKILIEGRKGTVFQKGEEVQIFSRGCRFRLVFSSEDGRYMGHILRGNRPCQHCCRGENLYTAFDWQIRIRPISWGVSPIQVRFIAEQKRESQPQLPLHASHYQRRESLL